MLSEADVKTILAMAEAGESKAAIARDVGLRPLIRDLMRSVAKLTKSAGRYRLQFSKDHHRFDWLVGVMHEVEGWWFKVPA